MVNADSFWRFSNAVIGHERYRYVYNGIFKSISEIEKQKLLSLLKKTKNIIPEVIIPQIDIAEEGVALEYPIQLENCCLLISHYSAKPVNGNVFSKKVCIEAAKKLCDLFSYLNEQEIILENFMDSIVLYDQKTGNIFFDLLPLLLELTDLAEMSFRKLAVEYYIAVPEKSRSSWLLNDCKIDWSNDVRRNSYFLSILLYKIVVGQTLFEWHPCHVMEEHKTDRKLCFSKNDSVFIPRSFYSDLEKLIYGDYKNDDENCLFQVPSEWKGRLLCYQCMCKEGMFIWYQDSVICPHCGKEYIGEVLLEQTGKQLQLLTQNTVGYLAEDNNAPGLTQYFLRDFGAANDSGKFLFKIQRKIDQDTGIRTAIAFSPDRDVEFIYKGISSKVTKTNVSGSMIVLDLSSKGIIGQKVVLRIDSKWELSLNIFK